MRELESSFRLPNLIKDQKPIIHEHHSRLQADELEKRHPLAAQSNHCAELEELQELLHFPEEVALRLADTEYQLFYQVQSIDYLRQVTLDLGGTTGTSTETLSGNSSAGRSSVATLIKRFNEVSAWVTQLIISQPTHDARRAVLSCVLRVALSSWNIGNFNGAMEIIAGLKSNKLKPFWLSITEKETLPVLDFLSAALLSAEYDRALSRALAMAECPVVPFFGAFLRELREILSSPLNVLDAQNPSGGNDPTIPHKMPKSDSRRQDRDQQQRQVLISDYNGEDQHFRPIGPGGLNNLEKMYRTQAVMDHIAQCHQHYHMRNRLSSKVTLLNYLRSTVGQKQRVLAATPPEKVELDQEYECDVDDYHPVQPLIHDHGVSFVCLSSPHTKIDQHVMQILHHGSTVLLWEGIEGLQQPSAPKGVLLFLRLDRSCTTLTWVRPSWSGLKAGYMADGDPFSTDFNLSFNPEDTLSPGLLTKFALQSSGEQSTGTTLDDGFLDLSIVKEVHLGGRDVASDLELSSVARRYGLIHESGNECALSILYGNGISDNRMLYIVCPATICRVWFSGLCWLIAGLSRQNNLSDRRLLWLREQYMQLYHEEGYCFGPLAADAIRSFGGRDWSLAGMSGGGTGSQPSETSGLRREVSMKIKKKQIMSNQAFKDKSLKYQFVEPTTMCMESSYWRNPTHHRQSTPTTFAEHQPDVARHHSLGHLAYNYSQPKFERERHGSTEHLWHGRHPRVGSILYDTQLDFIDFVTLFRSFSLLIRKDLRDLFEQLAISYRSMAVNTTGATNLTSSTTLSSATKVNGVKSKPEAQAKKPQKLGLLTRNSKAELEGSVVNSQKKIYDAIAAASIFTNCAGIDTNNSQVITISTFTKFLETRQMEVWTEDDVKSLIQRHEPDATLRSQHCLSFEGFARYLMDKDNFAFVNEREVPCETEMNRPMSTYYIASSHNTYLTGHQLKGESSVELYSQVLLTGCRCVELDCWDGEDGNPMIYHGHTFTTKIPFNAVVQTIEKNAFVTSPYPIILSIENHCSLQQQSRMAHIFQKAFGEKLVSSFLFDTDYSDEPCLPSPEQLKYRILIKNKKLVMDMPPQVSNYSIITTPVRTNYRTQGGVRHSVPGRTSSIISNTSSSSFNDDYSDDEFDDEDDEDNIDEKPIHSIIPTTDSPRSIGISHTISKTSSTKRPNPDDKLKKRSSQISKDLSDLVVYVQAIKFRGLNTISPSSSVKQRNPRIMTTLSSSCSSTITPTTSSSSSTLTNISGSSVQTNMELADVVTTLDSVSIPEVPKPTQSQPLQKNINITNAACFQCSSINENTAKKLCRKQPLGLVAHTESQLMRTYPAAMRIDSSNFNPVVFWSFGIQLAALNYQTEDISMQLNTAFFETNGKVGYVSKPNVMWDKFHVMYRRFNPWDKEFDGIHSSMFVINILSGQYVSVTNVNLSTYVEIEIIGIPVDCNKQKTKIAQKNALNPIWNESFNFRVLFHDLAFLRFSVIDTTTNHLLAQRIFPLKNLRPGYRHLRLRTPQNKPLNMSTLFIYSHIEEESLVNSKITHQLDTIKKNPVSSIVNDGFATKYTTLATTISGTPLCVKRRMFFLMVYGVVVEEPYTILKITQESTTQDVLILALQKMGQSQEKLNDYILVEEVARGWEKKDHQLPATQRVLDLQERPLQAQSQWKGDGRFILKRMGDDPSSRAWLSSIRSVANREREARKSDSSPTNTWLENDTFLVCIYNVAPQIPYAILKVPLNACSQDVLAQALVKARRLEDPLNFVIVEELEFGGTNHNIQIRPLDDFENVYSAQSHWQTIGRFVMQERSSITPTSLRKNRITSSLRLATLDKISKSFISAKNIASGSSKSPVQIALSDPTTSTIKFSKPRSSEDARKMMIRAKVHSEKDTNSTSAGNQQRSNQVHREVHSEGETLTEDEEAKDTDLLSTVSRLKKVSLRKLKEWKS